MVDTTLDVGVADLDVLGRVVVDPYGQGDVGEGGLEGALDLTVGHRTLVAASWLSFWRRMASRRCSSNRPFERPLCLSTEA